MAAQGCRGRARSGRAVLVGWGLVGIASLARCVVPVDLRDPSLLGDRDGGDAACGPAERFDPPTGTCAPCTYEDPRAVCPCGFEVAPASTSPCDPDLPPFRCLWPCRGDIGACTGFAEDAGRRVARDCGLLLACCASLGEEPDSEPCCPEGHSLLCTVGGIDDYPYEVRCVDNGPCALGCAQGAGCAPFQSCQEGRCLPGCDPQVAYCTQDATTFTCQPYVP